MPSQAQHHRTFWYNFFRYGFSFSIDELKQMIISILLIAFLWSFNKWGTDSFDFFMGMKNFLIGALFATIATIFNQIGQRIVAVYYGYDPIYESGMLGLMVGLVIAFASRGYLIFFFPGAINIRHLTASRLGEFRYYTNDWEWAKAGFQGPFFNVILIVFLGFFKQHDLVRQLMIMNIFFAIYSLIPLPGNVGLYLFYPHIHVWSLMVGIVLSISLLVFLVPPIWALVFSIFIGLMTMWQHFGTDNPHMAFLPVYKSKKGGGGHH